jgi:hypothetical protein
MVFAGSGTAGGVAGFGDVEAGAFYTQGVQWMVDENITTGVTPECFEPYAALTRGQVATFLWRMEDEPAPVGSNDFVDVNDGDFFETAVQWMVDENITSGTTTTTFEPYLALNRAQFATFLWRLEGEPAPVGSNDFVDVPPGAFFETAVQWMVDENITSGTTDTTFAPGDTVTRGQVATFLWRYNNEPPVVVDDASPLCRGRDDFNGTLQAGWSWLGGDPAARSLALVPGELAMVGDWTGGWELLFRDPVTSDFEIETLLVFLPFANFQFAGLSVDQDDSNWISFGRAFCDVGPPDCGGDGIYLDNVVNGSLPENAFVALPPSTDYVYLRLRHETGLYTGSYSLDGSNWTTVGSVNRVLVEPTVGIGTGQSQYAPAPLALFDWFEERPG